MYYGPQDDSFALVTATRKRALANKALVAKEAAL